MRGSASFRRRIASCGSTAWASCAVRSTRRYGLVEKFLIVPPMTFALPTKVCTLSGVSMAVVNRPDGAHRALDVAREHVVADLERPQHEDERAGREVREQAGPRGADGDADGGDQRGERRRLDPEVAEDPDHQQHVQRHRDGVADVADDGRLDLLPLERLLDQRAGDADQPAPDDVDGDRADHLEPHRDRRHLRGFHHVLQVHPRIPSFDPRPSRGRLLSAVPRPPPTRQGGGRVNTGPPEGGPGWRRERPGGISGGCRAPA